MSIDIPYKNMSFSAGNTLTASEQNQLVSNINALADASISEAAVKKLIPTFITLTASGSTGSNAPTFSFKTNAGSTITGTWENSGTGVVIRGGGSKIVRIKSSTVTRTSVTGTNQLTRLALQPVEIGSTVYYSVPYFENQAAPTMARQTYFTTTVHYSPTGTEFAAKSTGLTAVWIERDTIRRTLGEEIFMNHICKKYDGIEVIEEVYSRCAGYGGGSIPSPYCQNVSPNSYNAVATLEIWEVA